MRETIWIIIVYMYALLSGMYPLLASTPAKRNKQYSLLKNWATTTPAGLVFAFAAFSMWWFVIALGKWRFSDAPLPFLTPSLWAMGIFFVLNTFLYILFWTLTRNRQTTAKA